MPEQDSFDKYFIKRKESNENTNTKFDYKNSFNDTLPVGGTR